MSSPKEYCVVHIYCPLKRSPPLRLPRREMESQQNPGDFGRWVSGKAPRSCLPAPGPEIAPGVPASPPRRRRSTERRGRSVEIRKERLPSNILWMDEIHFAPLGKPWLKPWFVWYLQGNRIISSVVEDFVHPQYVHLLLLLTRHHNPFLTIYTFFPTIMKAARRDLEITFLLRKCPVHFHDCCKKGRVQGFWGLFKPK